MLLLSFFSYKPDSRLLNVRARLIVTFAVGVATVVVVLPARQSRPAQQSLQRFIRLGAHTSTTTTTTNTTVAAKRGRYWNTHTRALVAAVREQRTPVWTANEYTRMANDDEQAHGSGCGNVESLRVGEKPECMPVTV
jgi:hypothetical protein